MIYVNWAMDLILCLIFFPTQHCFYDVTMLKCVHLVHWCKHLSCPPSCASTFYLPIPLAMDTSIAFNSLFYKWCCEESLPDVPLWTSVRMSPNVHPVVTLILNWVKSCRFSSGTAAPGYAPTHNDMSFYFPESSPTPDVVQLSNCW